MDRDGSTTQPSEKGFTRNSAAWCTGSITVHRIGTAAKEVMFLSDGLAVPSDWARRKFELTEIRQSLSGLWENAEHEAPPRNRRGSGSA